MWKWFLYILLAVKKQQNKQNPIDVDFVLIEHCVRAAFDRESQFTENINSIFSRMVIKVVNKT
jgi:ethanolamine utilization protein EutP (predicted NTPase)